jgi:hypothetical protein
MQKFVAGEKYFTIPTNDKRNRSAGAHYIPRLYSCSEGWWEKDGREMDLPASDAATSPQPVSPKCSNTLCFSELKIYFLDMDISSDGCAAVEVLVVVEAAQMNSTRSQRFWYAMIQWPSRQD